MRLACGLSIRRSRAAQIRATRLRRYAGDFARTAGHADRDVTPRWVWGVCVDVSDIAEPPPRCGLLVG